MQKRNNKNPSEQIINFAQRPNESIAESYQSHLSIEKTQKRDSEKTLTSYSTPKQYTAVHQTTKQRPKPFSDEILTKRT